MTDSTAVIYGSPRALGPRVLWGITVVAVAAGAVTWALGAGLVALWCFVVGSIAATLVLPLPYALVAPLFIGLLGWLVDMLPFVVLTGWAAIVCRFAWQLAVERRLPRGGRWIWLPIGVVVWTALGALVVPSIEFKHFLLLLGIQGLSSGILLAVVDAGLSREDCVKVVSGLVLFIVVLSAAVLMEWLGVPVQALQDSTVSARAEEAYGVNAFTNSIGMIKWVPSSLGGAGELRADLDHLSAREPDMPQFAVFRPKFKAFEKHLVVRFDGSARPWESQLRAANVNLIYDNVGLGPAITVPRLRSFPRNALTYAGACAALFPLAFWLVWSDEKRLSRLGWLGVASALIGAGFSLARGAWIAILIGMAYLLIDGVISKERKFQILACYIAGAAVLTGVFFVKYGVDPINARAGGQGSINTRETLYQDTLSALGGAHLLVGYGTERSRAPEGNRQYGEYGHYIPPAGTHSTYLNYLFRTGLPGALGIAAIYAIAGLFARARAKESRGRDALFPTLAAAAVIILAAHGVILSLYVEPAYTLVVSLVIGLAMSSAQGIRGSILPWRKRTA